jgi:hypothetical protein
MKQVGEITKFKLVCEYSRKLNGDEYSPAEKENKEHILYYASEDYTIINGRLGRIRHDLAYLQCIEHIYLYWDYIDASTLFLNDSEKGHEIKIGAWNKANFNETHLCELLLEKQQLHVLCVGVVGPPLL